MPDRAVRLGGMRAGFLIATILALVIVPFLLWGDAIEVSVMSLMSRAEGPLIVGILVVALLAADVFLPVPSSLVIAAAALVLGPLGAIIAGAAGLTLGACVGYGAARWIGAERIKEWIGTETFEALQAHRGAWPLWLIVMRPVPVLSEGSIIVAGALAAPPLPALASTSLANVAVAALYAGVAGTATDAASQALAFAIVCFAPAAFWLLARWALARRAR